MDKQIIGRIEIASLPKFDLYNQTVKIDSGAYTSSIDVFGVRKENDILYVRFEDNDKEIAFPKFKTKRVKSSNGIVQERYVISGTIVIGKIEYKTKFSLTDRSNMRYPILLGRKLLNKHFLIDTSKVKLLS